LQKQKKSFIGGLDDYTHSTAQILQEFEVTKEQLEKDVKEKNINCIKRPVLIHYFFPKQLEQLYKRKGE
jgi:hypothetical protein